VRAVEDGEIAPVSAESTLAFADGRGDIFGFALFFCGNDFDGIGTEWGSGKLGVFFADGSERVAFRGNVSQQNALVMANSRIASSPRSSRAARSRAACRAA